MTDQPSDPGYVEASTRAMAKLYAYFYRELLDQGVPEARAAEFTKEYMRYVRQAAADINAKE